MRYAYLILAFVLLFKVANCQLVKPVEYDTCSNLRILEGEWMSVKGEDTIRVYLNFHRSLVVWYEEPEKPDCLADNLYGWIEIKKGSAIIFSDYSNRLIRWHYDLDYLPAFYRNLHSLYLDAGRPGPLVIPVDYISCKSPIKEIGGSFDDILRCDIRKTVYGIVNNSATEMTWYVRQFCAFFTHPLCMESTLPAEFVLTKQ